MTGYILDTLTIAELRAEIEHRDQILVDQLRHDPVSAEQLRACYQAGDRDLTDLPWRLQRGGATAEEIALWL
jgi:hypothetical protein